MKNILKFIWPVFGIASAITIAIHLTGCQTTNGVTTLDPTAQTVLSAIQNAAKQAAASGALPSGSKGAGSVTDAQTIGVALQTLNSGTGISIPAAQDVAASFKSNSATTGFITLGATIIDALLPAINALVNSGASTSTVQNVTNQVLANAPSAVAAGLNAPSPAVAPIGTPTTSTWKFHGSTYVVSSPVMLWPDSPFSNAGAE